MSTWHPAATVIDAYVDGGLDDPRACSVEAHLLMCADCRSRVAVAVDQDRLDQVWVAVAAELEAPRPTAVERLLLRLGVRDHVARLVAATPALGLAWLGAVTAGLAFAVLAAHVGPDRWGRVVFLALAPVLPVAGVAAAYGAGADPAHELGVAAPLHGWRLLQLRATAVLAASVVLAGLAALALPGLGWLAAAWLLPALGASSATVALSTIVAPRWAAGGIAFAWLSAVAVGVRVFASPLTVFAAPTQVVMALAAVTGLIVTIRRRDRFDVLA